MEKKHEKAIENLRLATQDLIQDFMNTLNNAQSEEDIYQKKINRWIKAKTELEKLNLSMTIKEFEFGYAVYQKIFKPPNTKRGGILSLNAQDNKILRSLKIIPPDDEEKNKK